MPFLGKTPAQGFVNSVTKDDFTPNGTTTAFTLSKAPATVNEIEVYVGNVRQEPTDAYSVSGTTLAMTEAPATGTNFYVMHIGGTTQSSTTLPGGSVVPGALSVSGDLAVDTSTLKVSSTNNNVGIGTSSPTSSRKLHINDSSSWAAIRLTGAGGNFLDVKSYGNTSSGSIIDAGGDQPLRTFINGVERLRIESDGRGLSQFTAKAWVNYRGITTNAIRDSHNVSSVTDNNAGRYTINFENAMANVNYVPTTGNIAYQLNQGDNRFIQVVNSISTTSLGISNTMVQNGFNYTDAEYVFITIFGD